MPSDIENKSFAPNVKNESTTVIFRGFGYFDFFATILLLYFEIVEILHSGSSRAQRRFRGPRGGSGHGAGRRRGPGGRREAAARGRPIKRERVCGHLRRWEDRRG